MPVIAVAGMIGGASALAAGGLTALETIAAIGGIVGGIGALTGNKTLTQIGAVAGLAGGIGAFAQNQGWLASGSAADTVAQQTSAGGTIDALKNAPSGAEVSGAVGPVSATGDASAAGTATQAAGSAPAGQLDMGEPAQSATEAATTNSVTDNIAQASPAANAMGGPSGLMNAGAPTASGTSPAPTSGMTTPDPGSASPALMTATAPNAPPAIDGIPQGDYGPGAGPLGASNTYPGTSGAPGVPGPGSKVLDLFKSMFTDKNGKPDKTMLALAGNFVGGMFDKQKAATADLLQARADTERQQLQNANAVPVMGFRSTTQPGGVFRPTQPTYQPVRVGGLMNAS